MNIVKWLKKELTTITNKIGDSLNSQKKNKVMSQDEIKQWR